MTLTLSILNVDLLENGAPTEFVLYRRGATIGRAPTCDWSLPDPHRYISSTHCEISFRDEDYVLADVSTNGTFLNKSGERMAAERIIESGDLLQIGHYEIRAELTGRFRSAPPRAEGSDQTSEGRWQGWEAHAPQDVPRPVESENEAWGPPASALPGGSASRAPAQHPAPSPPSSSNWGTPPSPAERSPGPAWGPSHHVDMPRASPWEEAAPAPEPASGWSSAAPDRPAAPSADDVWGRIAEGNVVDWARGGFGQPRAPASDPLGLSPPAPASHLPQGGAPIASAAPVAPPVQEAPRDREPQAAELAPARSAPAPAVDAERLVAAFLGATGLPADEVKTPGPELVTRAGTLLNRLVAGLVVLIEARARAKSQMGAESTRLEFDGNNPIKFARSPEQALAHLLNPRERGFMDPERAIEDAFFDLQSHQMATLKAMQGALKATLDRFSPESIRRRTEPRGVLAGIFPAARDAALWRNYERDFSGVARGSDEAFMDVFAKEFRKAYEEQSRQRR